MTEETGFGWCCPQCKTRFFERGKHFPFCCERCRMIDLANWLGGGYVISRSLEDNEPWISEHGDSPGGCADDDEG